MARYLYNICMLWINRHFEQILGVSSGTTLAWKLTPLLGPVVAVLTGVVTAALSTIVTFYIKRYLNRKHQNNA